MVRVLEAVARGSQPPRDDLDSLPEVVQHYLSDTDRLLADEVGPSIGSPVRLTHDTRGRALLSIEFCQHDDDFADGGWILWLWVLSLARPPTADRDVIGVTAPHRARPRHRLVALGVDGVWEGERRVVTYDEISRALQQASADDRWSDWTP